MIRRWVAIAWTHNMRGKFRSGSIHVFLQAIYRVTEIQLYVNNDLKEDTTTVAPEGARTGLDGRIVLGRHLVNTAHPAYKNGAIAVDWLTIWDRLLTEEERVLVHRN